MAGAGKWTGSGRTTMNRLPRLAINDEGFVFDPSTGESFTVNKTGLDIIRELKAGKAQEDIAAALADTYDVDTGEAERDVMDFADRLRSFQLIGGDLS